LQATRWPERQTTDNWRQGFPPHDSGVVAYWRTAMIGDVSIDRLNAYPNSEPRSTVWAFIPARSFTPRHARQSFLTHGWPGSIVEFLNVIGPLTNPTNTASAEDAFHVVLPSLLLWLSDKPTRAAGAYRESRGHGRC